MTVLGVIPARYASTRFPGKPLKLIAGKPLIQWVLEGASNSRTIDKIVVATDHEEIRNLVESLGYTAVMTDSELPSGSDRVWQASQNYAVEILINIQGDEPLITGELLDQLVEPLLLDEEIEMATLGRAMTADDLESQNTAKIVLNHRGEAMYFSRYPIPYSRSRSDSLEACLKHIGIYAYRKSFLKKFCEQSPVGLELAEGLEQLRALYLGAKIKVVKVDHDSWGVDTPEDVEKIESLLAKREQG